MRPRSRSRCSCSPPVAITCAIGVLVGLPALRLSGLYLALITLMFAGATTVVLSAIDFPNGGGGFKGRSLTGALTTEHAACATAVDGDRRTSRTTATPSSSARSCSCSRCVHVAAQAGARLGVDPRERAGGARRRRQHHALQALGVRARVVRHRRRRLPARSAGRSAARDHLPDPGLAHPGRDGADRRHLQPLGRGRRRRASSSSCRSSSRRSGALNPNFLLIIFGAGLLQVLLTAPGGLADQLPKDLAKLGRLVAAASASRRAAEKKAP